MVTSSSATGSSAVSEHHPLLQLLAVLATPYSKTALLGAAQKLRVTGANGRAFNAQDVRNVLSQGLKNKWLVESSGGVLCAPDHALAAFKAAVLSGQLARWCDRLLQHLHVIDSMQRVTPGYTWELKHLMALRIAAYAGQESIVQQMRQHHWYDEPLALARIFDGYVDAELLGALQTDLADELVAQLLDYGLESPRARILPILDWAVSRGGSAPALPRLRLAVIQQLLWRTRFEQAAAFAGESGLLSDLLQASTAVMRGQYLEALPLFERAAAALPPDSQDKRGRLPLPSAWLHVAAMIASDDHQVLERAAGICRKLSKGHAARWLWSSLQVVIAARSGEPTAAAWFTISGHSLFNDLTQAIAYAWLQQRPDTHSRQTIEQWVQVCEQAGYVWPANELRACLAMWARQRPKDGLAAAFIQEQSWQRALAAIASLQGDGTEPNSADQARIAWIVYLTGASAVESIEPWEQKRSNKGWSKGRKLALSALVRNESLLAHDARVVQAARATQGASYELDVHRALRALIGHTAVFFDDDWTTPVELTAAEPELMVTRSGSGAQLALQPSAAQVLAAFGTEISAPQAKAVTHPCLVRRHAPHSAQVIVLNPAHRRVAKLLGDVMHIPTEGAEQLRAALASAALHFTVHADADAVASDEVQGDATLRAELSPRGLGLRLHLVVRPFGTRGPRYTPGHGGARVFAKTDGQPRAVLRNLDAERAAVTKVVAALERFDLDAETLEADCEHPSDCLELITALQDLGDVVQIDWPAGVKYRVSRAHGVADLQVRLGRQRDWFVADGGLQLDDGTVLELRRLLDAARGGHGRFVPLDDSGFVALSADLERRITDLALLDDAKSGAAKLPLTAALAVADATEGARLQSTKEWRQAMERIQEARALQPEPPSTLQAQLRPYQVDGFQWLARLAHWGGGACLADDMGLGKTLQALALLLTRAPHGPALIVAPTSVCQNWLDEALRFAPTLQVQWFAGATRSTLLDAVGPFDVVVCSYTLLQQEIESFTAKSWHSVVLDEAQAVKNFATKRAQAVLALKADFRLAVTGTPVENRLEELWMLFRFLNPGLLGSRERFTERFAAPIERSNNAQTRAHLRRLIAPFMLRRTKSEVLTELPPRTEITLSVEPDAEESAFHEALRQNALAALADPSVPGNRKRFQVLTELTRVRRACCHPQLVAPETTVGSAKLKAFAELVTELIANRHKALVFSQFVDHLSLLRAHLDAVGIRYQYLDGSTPAAERALRVQAFQSGEGELFLISLRAGGVGLNLTAADYVIITDPWWNPAVEDQAASRAHRMGQERPVTVYRLVVKGSVEEQIMKLHGEKRALAEGLFNGEEFGGAWSVDDLMELLRVG